MDPTSRRIVCGAKNYVVGDKVPLALQELCCRAAKIKMSKLRGVESEGMLCSSRNLVSPTIRRSLDPAEGSSGWKAFCLVSLRYGLRARDHSEPSRLA